jgi:potassium-dependent mechanosensitive channel
MAALSRQRNAQLSHRFGISPLRRLSSGLAALALAMLVLLAIALPHGLAQEAEEALRSRLIDMKARLGAIEATLARDNLDDAALGRLRDAIEPLRRDVVALETDATGPRDAAKARLDKLGPPPKPEEPPESADILAARKREQTVFGDLDGLVKEAQVQAVRADQLANVITEKRRDAFAQELTQRGASILDPFFWIGVGEDLPQAGWNLMVVYEDALAYLDIRLRTGTVLIALALICVGALVALFLRYRLQRLRLRLAAREDAVRPDRGPDRLLAAAETVLGLVYAVLGWPMAAFVPLLALRIADLLPERMLDQFGQAIVTALLVAVIFDATSDGLLAVGKPAVRLLPLSDWAVRRIRRRTRWVAIILGLYVLARMAGKAIYAPLSLTVAATALASLAMALSGASLLVRLRKAPDDGVGQDDMNGLDILRPILWIAVIAVFASLVAGYIALAGFFAVFPVAAIFIAAIAYILMVLIDSVLTEVVAGDSQRARAVARAIGVSPKNIAFTGALLSGILRFLIVGAALLTVIGPLGFYSADIVSSLGRGFFGFQVGEITISPAQILLGFLLLAAILLFTRLIQTWIRATLLPRTALDAGLQNSIATVIGYVGVVLALAVGLSQLGLNLQNFAIIAGALSLGIGLSLQPIVSNFVSGLILLAERPIRVGDIIAVGEEEGFVRRISARATAIETYDRATLIIPNSQLITATVKNWVYGNTWSRVKVALQIAYDNDIEAVRLALLASAQDDPRILPSPPPRVFLARLGETAIEVELIVVVASVETMPAVRSDLQLRILRLFRERGLRLAGQGPAASPPPAAGKISEG